MTHGTTPWADRWRSGSGEQLVTLPAEKFDALMEIAYDALALLDQHITDEQDRELRYRIIERVRSLQ